MRLTPRERRAIERADRERRERAEQAEIEAILSRYPKSEMSPYAMLVNADAKAIGAVTALTHRVSQSSWEVKGRPGTLRGRVRGFAAEDGVTCSNEPDTVRVTHADGSRETRHLDSFRKIRTHRARARASESVAPSLPETARAEKYGTHILTGE